MSLATSPFSNLTAQPAAGSGGLVSKSIEAIYAHIRTHGLGIDDLLPSEGAFAEEFGVSRIVVREAFRSLAAMGLISIGNGRRARVAAIDSNALALIVEHAVHVEQMTIQQIYDLRRTLEGRTVTLAALRRHDREAAQIGDLAAAMRSDFDNPEEVMEHDIAFHAAIAAAARNPAFSLVLGGFEKVMRQTWPIGWRCRATDALRMESVESHEAIARAIMTGDTAAAQSAMADHFDNSVKALVSAGVI